MKELITTGGVSYAVENVKTGINTISFTVVDPTVNDVEAVFKKVKELTVGAEEEETYGIYPNVRFESILITADEKVTVTMHILTETEKQIRDLQESQADQVEVIANLLYGGDTDE